MLMGVEIHRFGLQHQLRQPGACNGFKDIKTFSIR
jgi:hypothetical protein